MKDYFRKTTDVQLSISPKNMNMRNMTIENWDQYFIRAAIILVAQSSRKELSSWGKGESWVEGFRGSPPKVEDREYVCSEVGDRKVMGFGHMTLTL